MVCHYLCLVYGVSPLTAPSLASVRNATWSAAHELHATTGAGVPASSVSLHYRARTTQVTGEDWTDVGLTLSTADMDLSNQAIPVLSPTKIRPKDILLVRCRAHAGVTTATAASPIRKRQCQTQGQERCRNASAIQFFRFPCCRSWPIWRNNPASDPAAATASTCA